MQERRQSTRQTKCLGGRIYFNDGHNSLPCLFRDISYEGARIIVAHLNDIPDEIELYIPKRKRIIHASVRWRHGDKLGLAFSEVASRPAPPSGRHHHAPIEAQRR